MKYNVRIGHGGGYEYSPAFTFSFFFDAYVRTDVAYLGRFDAVDVPVPSHGRFFSQVERCLDESESSEDHSASLIGWVGVKTVCSSARWSPSYPISLTEGERGQRSPFIAGTTVNDLLPSTGTHQSLLHALRSTTTIAMSAFPLGAM